MALFGEANFGFFHFFSFYFICQYSFVMELGSFHIVTLLWYAGPLIKHLTSLLKWTTRSSSKAPQSGEFLWFFMFWYMFTWNGFLSSDPVYTISVRVLQMGTFSNLRTVTWLRRLLKEMRSAWFLTRSVSLRMANYLLLMKLIATLWKLLHHCPNVCLFLNLLIKNFELFLICFPWKM